MLSLTDLEKNIYNAYLIASRSVQNKPFKIRKDFSSIDDETYILLKKLALFFIKNNSVKLNDYFIASYDYYGKENYFDLKYFLTPKAIKCFSLYMKKKETQSPDNEETINNCKECCSFIFKYCKEHNLTLDEYKNLINGTTPIVMQHIRDHNINFYVLHGLECEKIIRQVEPDLLDFFIKDFNNILNETRVNFQKSTRLKVVIRKALSIIENQLIKLKITNNNNKQQ